MSWTRILGGSLFASAAIVFLSYFVSGLVLGGDALNGKVEGDRYFVGSHGHYIEVSEGTYLYSRVHGILLLVVFPLGIILGGFLLSRAERKDRERIAGRLGERPPLTASQFAERYFGPEPRRIDLAARLRDILEKETRIPMAGLLADDRLADVSASIAAGEPFLFLEIEQRLHVDTGVMDLAKFIQTAERIQTFRELVDYVASCPSKEPIEQEGSSITEDMGRGRLVKGIERWLSFAFGNGWVVVAGLILAAILAALVGWPMIVFACLGTAVSLFGLALGGVGLWLWLLAIAVFRARRKLGQNAGACFGLILCGCAGTFVAWCGGGAIWGFFSNWAL
jgi:hypothetical protein